MIDSSAMVSIVDAAFFDSGRRKAGTPFETASTPVIAVQPFANAVSSRNSVSGCDGDATGSPPASGCAPPVSTRHAPTAMSASMVTMKK